MRSDVRVYCAHEGETGMQWRSSTCTSVESQELKNNPFTPSRPGVEPLPLDLVQRFSQPATKVTQVVQPQIVWDCAQTPSAKWPNNSPCNVGCLIDSAQSVAKVKQGQNTWHRFKSKCLIRCSGHTPLLTWIRGAQKNAAEWTGMAEIRMVEFSTADEARSKKHKRLNGTLISFRQ